MLRLQDGLRSHAPWAADRDTKQPEKAKRRPPGRRFVAIAWMPSGTLFQAPCFEPELAEPEVMLSGKANTVSTPPSWV